MANVTTFTNVVYLRVQGDETVYLGANGRLHGGLFLSAFSAKGGLAVTSRGLPSSVHVMGARTVNVSGGATANVSAGLVVDSASIGREYTLVNSRLSRVTLADGASLEIATDFLDQHEVTFALGEDARLKVVATPTRPAFAQDVLTLGLCSAALLDLPMGSQFNKVTIAAEDHNVIIDGNCVTARELVMNGPVKEFDHCFLRVPKGMFEPNASSSDAETEDAKGAEAGDAIKAAIKAASAADVTDATEAEAERKFDTAHESLGLLKQNLARLEQEMRERLEEQKRLGEQIKQHNMRLEFELLKREVAKEVGTPGALLSDATLAKLEALGCLSRQLQE